MSNPAVSRWTAPPLLDLWPAPTALPPTPPVSSPAGDAPFDNWLAASARPAPPAASGPRPDASPPPPPPANRSEREKRHPPPAEPAPRPETSPPEGQPPRPPEPASTARPADPDTGVAPDAATTAVDSPPPDDFQEAALLAALPLLPPPSVADPLTAAQQPEVPAEKISSELPTAPPPADRPAAFAGGPLRATGSSQANPGAAPHPATGQQRAPAENLLPSTTQPKASLESPPEVTATGLPPAVPLDPAKQGLPAVSDEDTARSFGRGQANEPATEASFAPLAVDSGQPPPAVDPAGPSLSILPPQSEPPLPGFPGPAAERPASGDPPPTAVIQGEAATSRPPRGIHDQAALRAEPAAPSRTEELLLARVVRAVTRAHQQDGEVRLRLYPPELGSLQVALRVQEGALVAQLHAETEAARSALFDQLPVLRERLAEQGIRLERFEVDLMQRQGGQLPDQSGGRPRDWPRAERAALLPPSPPPAGGSTAPPRVRPLPSGGLDVLV